MDIQDELAEIENVKTKKKKKKAYKIPNNLYEKDLEEAKRWYRMAGFE